MSQEQIVRALGVTAEAMGQQLSPAGLLLMADDLAAYGVETVLAALTKVRRECRRLSVADVIERIQIADGRPKSDEAWANALAALDESETVVWTKEAAQAFEVARPLLEINDKTGARMAFRDAYERLCELARSSCEPAQWSASLGWDAERRRLVLEAAVIAGRLGTDSVRGLLPPPPPSAETSKSVMALVSNNGVLTDKASTAIERESARKRIAALKLMLTDPKAGAA